MSGFQNNKVIFSDLDQGQSHPLPFSNHKWSFLKFSSLSPDGRVGLEKTRHENGSLQLPSAPTSLARGGESSLLSEPDMECLIESFRKTLILANSHHRFVSFREISLIFQEYLPNLRFLTESRAPRFHGYFFQHL